MGSESNCHVTLGCFQSGQVIDKDSGKAGHYLFLLGLPHPRFSDLLELRFSQPKSSSCFNPTQAKHRFLIGGFWLGTSRPSSGLQMNPDLCLLPKLLLSGLVHPTSPLPQGSKNKQTSHCKLKTSNCRRSQGVFPFPALRSPTMSNRPRAAPDKCRPSCICHLAQTLPLVIKVEKLPVRKDPFHP